MGNSRIAWLAPTDPAEAFPAISTALTEPDGLLAAGGDLSIERLLFAYRHGIFPWFDEGQPILWWSPDPRCVLRPRDYHVSSRLRRSLPASDARLTANRAFGDVIRACAGPRRSGQDTWITGEMVSAYQSLHDEGWAHSIEVWEDEELVGGIYGLAIGKVFFGESMFSIASNASKLAMLGLCGVLIDHGFELIDCQVVSRHLLTLGATTMPRAEFAGLIEQACGDPAQFDDWPAAPVAVRALASG